MCISLFVGLCMYLYVYNGFLLIVSLTVPVLLFKYLTPAYADLCLTFPIAYLQLSVEVPVFDEPSDQSVQSLRISLNSKITGRHFCTFAKIIKIIWIFVILWSVLWSHWLKCVHFAFTQCSVIFWPPFPPQLMLLIVGLCKSLFTRWRQ